MQTAPVTLAQANDLSRPNGTDSTKRIFWSMMAIHVAIYLTVCLVTQPNLPLDMVEMLFWGQQWQLGYHKHPPLPAWITAAAWGIGGRALLYSVSQLTVVATFWAVWQFAREKLSPEAALCSVFVLQSCYYCTYMINDINNTIITRPFWALAILFLYRAIVREQTAKRNIYWALAGAAIGLGMLSKYYMGVLVIAMMALPLVSSQARQQLKTAGPWITTAVASLLFLPHFVWMCSNDFITLQYVLNRSGEASAVYDWTSHFKSPMNFLLKQLPAIVPMIVLATPLIFSRDPENSQEPLSRTDFFQRYLLVVLAGPVLIYLLLGFSTGSSIRSMWGGPLFSYFGVLLFAFFRMPNDKKKVNKILRDSVCLGAVMVIALAGRNLLGPSMRGKLSKVHYPGQEIASQVNDKWNQEYAYPLPIVGGTLFIAGCVGVYSPAKVDVYGSMSQQASPWLNDELIQQRGGVIVWEIDGSEEPPEGWLDRFKNVETLDSVLAFSRTFVESKPIKIGVAVVHPARPELAALHCHSLETTAERTAQLRDESQIR